VQLHRVAGLFEPVLQPLTLAVAALPWHYDRFRYGHIDWAVNDHTKEEFDAALAAARCIYAKCVAVIEKLENEWKKEQ
jgi:hypothetical protein